MNTDNHPECNALEETKMDIVCGPGMKPQADIEENAPDIQPTNLFNGMEHCEDAVPVKTEREELDDSDRYPEDEDGRGNHPKEEAEEEEDGSEDGLEDGFDEERPEEEDEEEERERDGDEEGDSLCEPQDLSLMDYSRYDGGGPLDSHSGEAAAGGAYMSGGVASRSQVASKLNCDICGLSCVSINVLLVHKRSHTGERPFHCNQCGASFTQKGNLLRHTKLHSGEKPFKCPMCSYACRRRDALSGHLRTHSVEKPYKCNHCGRSYKQRSSLEEHRERCHVYIQNKGPVEKEDSVTSRAQMGIERALLLDRLASNVAKRKSSMPQKFTGDNGVCLDLSVNRSNAGPPPLGSLAPEAHLQTHPVGRIAEHDLPHHRHYPVPMSRSDMSPLAFTNGHSKPCLPPPSLSSSSSSTGGFQPHQGHPGMESLHSDSPQPIMYSLGHLLGAPAHQNGLPLHAHHGQPIPLPMLEALQVVRAEGEEGGMLPAALYPCTHCRVIFLDYVMFTIHMGCHGFRDPLECNVCGHRSRDRYEFSSHLARGEHRLELK